MNLEFTLNNPAAFSLSSDGPIPFLSRHWYLRIPELPPKTALPQHLSSGSSYIIVTGANSGIGYEAVKYFAGVYGCRVIMAVRSMERGEQARARVETEYPGALSVLEVWPLDLESPASISDFCKRVEDKNINLFAAILNAGLLSYEYRKSHDGYDAMLQTNVLGNAQLSLGLLPALTRSSALNGTPSRILEITSEAHAWSKFRARTAPNLFAEHTVAASRNYSPGLNYHFCKLLLMMWERELAERVDTSKVVTASCSPGYCTTGLFRDNQDSPIGALAGAMWARGPDVGARTYVHALLDKPENFHNAYYSHGRITSPSAYVESADAKVMQKELWEQVADILKDLAPEVLVI
ncbi:hypothetical protein EDC01DRAFT_618370 [Geopyxis carbonaria]|nr:hypothetical protein EDC01DRAFT_618370 [Geopyxis carbonaria]